MTIMPADFRNRVLRGPCLEQLKKIPSGSVHLVITSPPFWRARDYGAPVIDWPEVSYKPLGYEDRFVSVPAMRAAFGQEESQGHYIAHFVCLMREVQRALRADGSTYLNVTSNYEDGNVDNIQGLIAEALKADGWTFRAEIIWENSIRMPESVKSRVVRSHEHILHLTQQASYYYDWVGIAEEGRAGIKEDDYDLLGGLLPDAGVALDEIRRAKNRRSVWRTRDNVTKGQHLVPQLISALITVGSSEKGCCPTCGVQIVRDIRETVDDRPAAREPSRDPLGGAGSTNRRNRDTGSVLSYPTKMVRTVNWNRGCKCKVLEADRCVVLDPFAGVGAVVREAIPRNRDMIAIEGVPERCSALDDLVRGTLSTRGQRDLFEDIMAGTL